MLRTLFYALLAALILWAIVAGVRSFFYTLPAKDRELAQISFDNMHMNPDLQDNLVKLSAVKEGEFRCETKGLNDAHAAGRFAYNAMVILMHQDNALVKTGRNFLTMHGYQDGKLIFDVTYDYEVRAIPEVTLRGRFEGENYVPTYGPVSIAPEPRAPSRQPSIPPTARGPFGLA
jgi:hypothetical protein